MTIRKMIKWHKYDKDHLLGDINKIEIGAINIFPPKDKFSKKEYLAEFQLYHMYDFQHGCSHNGYSQNTFNTIDEAKAWVQKVFDAYIKNLTVE